jgi:single-stranded DNA-binding protein
MSNSEGFTFQGKGKLARIDTFTSQKGKPIRTLVFYQDGQWPKWTPIKVFGRLADMASDWKPGDILEITGELGGREWQGKVYPDITARTVEVVAKGKQEESPPPADDGSDPPF